MKRIWYEWLKLIKNRVILLIVPLCLCVTLAYQWKESKEKYPVYEKAEYQSLLNQVMALEPEAAKEWLEEETAWYGFLAELAYNDGGTMYHSMESLTLQYPQTDWKLRLEEHRQAQTDSEATLKRLQMLRDLKQRVEYLLSYPEFLETVQRQADSMMSISLFSDMDAFSEKNILRTGEVYARLEGQRLGLDYSEAARAGSQGRLTDGMMLVLILIFGWLVFAQEREQGLYPLIRSAMNGRASLIAGKMAAYGISLLATAALLYGSQLLLAVGMYGTGNCSLPLASLSDFRNCPYEITIGTYFFLYFLIKMAAVLVIGWLAMLCFVSCRRYGAAVCLYFLAVGLEYGLYLGIDSVSPFNCLKYINFAAILDAKEWFTVYRNLNLFSQPYSAAAGKIVAVCICLILFSAAAVVSFCRRRRPAVFLFRGKRRRAAASVQKGRTKRAGQAVIRRFGSHVSIFLHEGYKLYRLGGMAVVLLLFAALSAWSAQGIPPYRGNTDQQVYRYYVEQLQGRYTEESRRLLREEELVHRMQDKEALAMAAGLEDGSVSEEEYEEWLSFRQLLIETRQKGFQRVRSQEDVIVRMQTEGENIGFADIDQLAYLFEDDRKQLLYAIVFLAAEILGIALLFGMERQQGITPLLESTALGRRPLYLRKLIQAGALITVFYLIVYCPYYSAVWRDMERVPSDLLLRGILGYERFELPLTIMQAFWVMVLVRYVAALSCGLFAAGITQAVKLPALGSAVSFLVLLMPCFLQLIGMDLSAWTCVGGFLPELVFRNGGTLGYACRLMAVLLLDAGIVCGTLFAGSKWRDDSFPL